MHFSYKTDCGSMILLIVPLVMVSSEAVGSHDNISCPVMSAANQWFSLLHPPQQSSTAQHNQDPGSPPDEDANLFLEGLFPVPIETTTCDIVTFKEYVNGLIRKEQQKTFPRTWIDETSLYNFTAYDEFDERGKKIYCPPRNRSSVEEARVKIVNSTVLLEKLGHKNDTVKTRYCAVVMFYAPWCPFCARVAPDFNALARAFPQLDVYAIDAVSFSKFGTVAVPNILIFHQSKAVARFNNTERTFEKLRSFVQNVTGINPNESVVVADQDYEGPLPNIPSDDPDYFLWFSWIFVLIFTLTCFARSATGKALWTSLEGYLGHNIERAHID